MSLEKMEIHSKNQSTTSKTFVIGFDLDMTLVNSSSAIVHVMSTVLKYPETQKDLLHFPTEKEIEETIGIPLKEAILGWIDKEKFDNDAKQIDEKADTIVADYRAIFDEIGLPKIGLLPYAKEALICLKECREKGNRGKGTTSDKSNTTGASSSLSSSSQDINDQDSLTVKVLLVSSRKGNSVHSILNHLELYPYFDVVQGDLFAEKKGEFLQNQHANCYVGDHPGDVRGAKYAKSISIAVATGHIGKEKLREEEPDILWDDLSQFPEWLQGHLQQY